MKKKTYMAILAMCMALAAAGCGGDAGKDDKGSTGTAAQQDAEKTDVPEEKAEEEKTEEEKPDSFGTRLVSVDSVDKYVTIGEYKGLSLDNTVEEVTDEEVQAQMDTERTDKAEEVTDKDGAVLEGDIVTINFVGTKDGKAFEGGTANNYDLTVGEAGFIDGFEDGLVGMKKGETKDLNLTFPEDYPQTDLAGEDVVFKVTLQNFRRVQELSDEWVAKNTEYTTTDEYQAEVKKQLEEDARAAAESNLKSTAWNTVLTNSEVKEYPQDDVDNTLAEFKSLYQTYAEQGGMELEEFVEAQGMTMENFEEQSKQYAEYKVKQNLVVQGIMDAEGMSLEDKECLAIQDQLIKDYGAKDLADLIDQYGQAGVDESIGLLRVEDFIVANAKVEEMVSNGEVVGQSGDGGDASKGIEEGIVDEEDENAGTDQEDTGTEQEDTGTDQEDTQAEGTEE